MGSSDPMTLAELAREVELQELRAIRRDLSAMRAYVDKQKGLGRFFGNAFHSAEQWIQMGRAMRMMDGDRVLGLDAIHTTEELVADWFDAVEQLEREPDIGLALGDQFGLASYIGLASGDGKSLPDSLTVRVDGMVRGIYISTTGGQSGAIRIPPSVGAEWVKLRSIVPSRPGMFRQADPPVFHPIPNVPDEGTTDVVFINGIEYERADGETRQAFCDRMNALLVVSQAARFGVDFTRR